MVPIAELLTQMAKALATREATTAWARGLSPSDLERAWTACPDARALFRLCAPSTKPELLVRASCACLRFALDQKKGHHRIRNAVKVLEQWSNGAAEWSDVERAGNKVGADRDDMIDALLAAASIPADRARAQDVPAALSLALSNDDTVYAASLPAPPRKTRVAALAQLAEVVRRVLPCPTVESLVAVA